MSTFIRAGMIKSHAAASYLPGKLREYAAVSAKMALAIDFCMSRGVFIDSRS